VRSNRHKGLLPNHIIKANMILDSGASVSVVHSSLLEGVKKSTRRIKRRKFVSANGENIGSGMFATFECVVGGKERKIKVVDALIIKTKESEMKQILLGSQDLKKAGIVLDFHQGLIRFEAGVSKVIPMDKRPVEKVRRITEDTSSVKNSKPTDLCMKWLEHKKSDKNRKGNVVLTENSVRQGRDDNRNAKGSDRYKVRKTVEGVRRMRGIDEEAVENRH
jgi:hypothetical protein